MFTYPIFGAGVSSGAVGSVEHITATFTSETSQTINLTQGQDYTRCVPFMTYRHLGSGAVDPNTIARAFRIDMIDNGGTPAVVIDRGGNTQSFEVSVYVVEFNEDIRVQKVAWEDATPDDWTARSYSIPETVDLTKTFIVSTMRTNGAEGNDICDIMARAYFTDADTLTIYRAGNFMNMPALGIAYIVEDLTDDHFTVQTVTAWTAATGNLDYPITAVDPAATMLVSTCLTDEAAGNSQYAAPSVYLLDEDTVRVVQWYGSRNRSWYVFVVEWHDGTSVQRGSYEYEYTGTPPATKTEEAALSPSVDTSKSMAHLTMHCPLFGIVESHSFDESQLGVTAVIREGGAYVDLARRWTVIDITVHADWEVVTFPA